MIRIDINNVIASAPAAQTAKNYVGSARNGVANVRWQIDGRVRSRSNIEARLNNVHYALGQIEAKICEIKNFTDFAANRYWQNEHYIRMCAMQLRTVTGLSGRNAFWPIDMVRNYLIYLYNRIFGWRRYIGHLVSDFAGLAARWVSGYDKLKLNVYTGAVNIINAGIGVLSGLVKWQNKIVAVAADTLTGAKSFVDASVNDANRFITRWQKELKTAGLIFALGPVVLINGGVISTALLALWLANLFGKKVPGKIESPKPKTVEKPKEKEKEEPPVPETINNPNGDVENTNKGRETIPFVTSNPDGKRSVAAYQEIVNQFHVADNPRYTPYADGRTWCNIYVWDVTRAMGAELPHYVNQATGEPMSQQQALDNPGSYLEQSCDRHCVWLEQYGPSYGWSEVTAEQATAAAAQGQPAIAIRPDHVAMIVPNNSGDTGVHISQAGAMNTAYTTLEGGFGQPMDTIRYYIHK